MRRDLMPALVVTMLLAAAAHVSRSWPWSLSRARARPVAATCRWARVSRRCSGAAVVLGLSRRISPALSLGRALNPINPAKRKRASEQFAKLSERQSFPHTVGRNEFLGGTHHANNHKLAIRIPASRRAVRACQRFAYRFACDVRRVVHSTRCQKLSDGGAEYCRRAKGCGGGNEPQFWAYYIESPNWWRCLLIAIGFLTRPLRPFLRFQFVAAFIQPEARLIGQPRHGDALAPPDLIAGHLIRGRQYSIDRRIGRRF